MSSDPKRKTDIEETTKRLREAEAVTPDLMSAVITAACARLPLLNTTGTVATRLARLLQSGAWADASLALIDIELPGWKLRRLVYDDGQWLCSLSRQPNMPVEWDDTADAYHQVMPLAIMGAFLEARRQVVEPRKSISSAVPHVSSTSGYAICCDNFS